MGGGSSKDKNRQRVDLPKESLKKTNEITQEVGGDVVDGPEEENHDGEGSLLGSSAGEIEELEEVLDGLKTDSSTTASSVNQTAAQRMMVNGRQTPPTPISTRPTSPDTASMLNSPSLVFNRPTSPPPVSSRPTSATTISSRPTSSMPTSPFLVSSRPTSPPTVSSRPTSAARISSKPTSPTPTTSRPNSAVTISSRPTSANSIPSRPTSAFPSRRPTSALRKVPGQVSRLEQEDKWQPGGGGAVITVEEEERRQAVMTEPEEQTSEQALWPGTRDAVMSLAGEMLLDAERSWEDDSRESQGGAEGQASVALGEFLGTSRSDESVLSEFTSRVSAVEIVRALTDGVPGSAMSQGDLGAIREELLRMAMHMVKIEQDLAIREEREERSRSGEDARDEAHEQMLREHLNGLARMLAVAERRSQYDRAMAAGLERELMKVRWLLHEGMYREVTWGATALQRFVRRKLTRLVYLEHRWRVRRHSAFLSRRARQGCPRPSTAPTARENLAAARPQRTSITFSDTPAQATFVVVRPPSASLALSSATAAHVGPPIWSGRRRPETAVCRVSLGGIGERAWSAGRRKVGRQKEPATESVLVLARFLNDVDSRGLRDMSACVLQAYVRRKQARLAHLERYARDNALRRAAHKTSERIHTTHRSGRPDSALRKVSSPTATVLQKRSVSPGRPRTPGKPASAIGRLPSPPRKVSGRLVDVLEKFVRIKDGRGIGHVAASVLQAYMQRKLTRAVYLYHRARMRLYFKAREGIAQKIVHMV